METTGEVDKIHISSALASSIKNLANSHLYTIIKRETLADIKGKGQLQTVIITMTIIIKFINI